MRDMGVQSMHQRGPFQDDTHAGMAMTVNASFVAFRDAEPALQLEIVSDLLEDPFANKEAREEARHHLHHLLVNRLLRTLQSPGQRLECLLPRRAGLALGFERRGYFLEVLDIAS